MKSEELLNSLDHIGEDLLAEAEQNILVRTRRPWLKTAVAAVLVAALGVGGWLTLNHFTMKSSVPATEPAATTAVTEPVREIVGLPMLEVGNTWNVLPALPDPTPALYDSSVTALPVYKVDPAAQDSQLSEAQRQALMDEVIRFLGATVTEKDRSLFEATDSPEDLNPFCLTEYTDVGRVNVNSEGMVCIEFADPRSIEQVQELLKFPAGSYAFAIQENAFQLVPALEDPAQQLLIRSFGGVILFCNSFNADPSDIKLVTWYQRSGTVDWSSMEQDWYYSLGNYPIITPEEARASVLNGDFYVPEWYQYYSMLDSDRDDLSASSSFQLTEELLSDVELVYSNCRFDSAESAGMQLPFYQFRIKLNPYSEFAVCVPAIRPEYLSDFPQPHSSDVEVTEPEPTEPEPSVMDPETLEQTLSEWERGLNGEYFSCYLVQDSYYNYYGSYFSDGNTRIWLENDAVLKKDLSTGEIETLFSLEPNAEIETALQGVTANRLYFGWNKAGNWWGKNVYSVDYHNENRVDWYDAQEVYFGGGWLRMESFRSDVRSFSLHVIDRNDELVVDYSGHGYYGDGGPCWGDTVVDGSLYFVKIEGLFSQWVESLSDAEREAVTDETWEAKRQHEQYTLFRLDPDGSISTIGSIEAPVTAMFHIDAEARELVNFCDGFYRYDLFTLEPIDDTAELPEDLHKLVVEDFSAQDRYTDDCGNVMDYSYSIPRLDANTQGARAINAEIGKQTEELRQWAEEHEDGGYSISVYSLSYEVYVWQDVVSVVMKKSYYYDYTEYFVYCYDCTAKRRLDTPALLEKLGISQERFLEACRTTFREMYENNTAAMPEEERAQYEKEFPEMLPESEKFVNLELQAYPGEDGTLMTVAPITSWVGAAFYYHLIPVLDIQN